MPPPDEWARRRSRAKDLVQQQLRRGGYALRKVRADVPVEQTRPFPEMVRYGKTVTEIEQRHAAQTLDDVAELGSQQLHVLQILEAMQPDKVDHDLVLAALIHDVGKVLLLTGEDPANVTCMNTPIGAYERGVGFDNVTFQWGHDEFPYTRLSEHLPDHLAWLVRYHSIEVSTCRELMDERDRDYYEKYLRALPKPIRF